MTDDLRIGRLTERLSSRRSKAPQGGSRPGRRLDVGQSHIASISGICSEPLSKLRDEALPWPVRASRAQIGGAHAGMKWFTSLSSKSRLNQHGSESVSDREVRDAMTEREAVDHRSPVDRAERSRSRRYRITTTIVCAVAGMLCAACGSTTRAAHSATANNRWVDQPVTFAAGGVAIYGTYRHPAGADASVPAAVLIGGSGPTDRNGNSAEIPGSIDTLKTVADWLSADGVASLRYDKLGTGQTGLGPYTSDPSSIGIMPYETEAAAALGFLARQRYVDRTRLAVIGHSEGALFALLLAARLARAAPAVHAIGLLEPLSVRYLGLLATQARTRLDVARSAGRITATQQVRLKQQLAAAMNSLRTGGGIPAGVPAAVGALFPPSSRRFLSQADRYDPAVVAAQLSPRIPALVTCSNADIQVSCGQVQRVIAALTRAGASTDVVRLKGVDHVLKEDASRTGTKYGEPLLFSRHLQRSLRAFVAQHL
jgi:uncharacterized protein